VTDGVNAEQREHWNTAEGEHWVNAEARFDEMLDPFTTVLLDAAAPGPDDAVLDVGCGTGGTTVAAAARAGRVTGVDISAPMIEAARRRAERAGVTNVDFAVRDVQVDDLPAGVDRVVSRFGVMFFDDPVAAFANIRGALAPDGRLVFVCWQGLAANPWTAVPALAVAEHVPPAAAPVPGAPGPFAFGDPDRVRSVLTDAGFGDVDVAPFTTTLLLGGRGTTDDAVTFLRNAGAGRRMLAGAGDDERDRALAALHDALAPHHDGEGVRLGAATWTVTARP
jgi:SAM-dependent methyltransferase